MAQQSSFFNANLVNGQYDRTYNAEDWAAYFASFLSNGIAYTTANTLEVQAGTGMSVLVDTGIAFINGYRYANTTPLQITINPANQTYNRITSIVVELNLNTRNIEVITLDGVPSPNPVAPDLSTTSGLYQLQLATVLVQAGATNILATNITDTRSNQDVCGWLELLMPESNEELTTLETAIQNADTQITTINDTLSTLQAYLGINQTTLSLNLSNVLNMNNQLTANDEILITENNGFLCFANEANQRIVSYQVNNDTFVLENFLTTTNIYSITPVTSGIDTININANINATQPITLTNTMTAEKQVYINDVLYLRQQAPIDFCNTTNEPVVNMYMDGNIFTMKNILTNNAWVLCTPVSTGIDTLQIFPILKFESNATYNGPVIYNEATIYNDVSTVNYELAITEADGYIGFNNASGARAATLQVNTNEYALQNGITNNVIYNFTPVTTGIDTLDFNAIVNLENGLQLNGTNVFSGGQGATSTQLTGNVSLATNETLAWSVQYWQMNTGSIVNSTSPTNSGIGVITVTLTADSNISWDGTINITAPDLVELSNMSAATMGENAVFNIDLNSSINSLVLSNVSLTANTSQNAPATQALTATAIIYG